jgi:DNA polymerase II small subunit/DNA polymerase delta subunit B
MLTEPRFSFPPPIEEPSSARRVRAAWISDMHLGTRGANAAALLDFLRDYDFDNLYIVGDLIDVWSMRRGRYWPQQHNDVIQKILRKARKGTRVFYIPAITTSWSAIFAAVTATSRFSETRSTSPRAANGF